MTASNPLKAVAAALVLSAVAGTAWAQVDPNRVVAIVNGEEIRGSEYYHRMEFLPGVGKIEGKRFIEVVPGLLALQQLINEKVLFQLANKKGAMPSDIELDSYYQTRTQDEPNLLQAWRESGRTDDDLKYTLKYELAEFKLRTFGITKTDQEVEAFFKAHPDQFTIPKQYKLHVIVLSDKSKEASVDSDLTSGKSFEDEAKAYSVDTTRAVGGDYGTVPVSGLGPKMTEGLSDVKVGQTTTWLETQVGNQPAWVKFRVDSITPEKKLEFTPTLKRALRRRLMLEAGSVKNNVGDELKALYRDSKVDIKQKEFAAAYKTLIQGYLGAAPAESGAGK